MGRSRRRREAEPAASVIVVVVVVLGVENREAALGETQLRWVGVREVQGTGGRDPNLQPHSGVLVVAAVFVVEGEGK